MVKANVYNTAGEKIKEVELNPKVFGIKVKPELVQWAIVVQQANKRKNLAHAKDRSEVAGGGRKPWRQKGTGRARHGSIRSPLWRGGGVTFGPTKDQNFSLKINKKAKRKSILMGLSDKAANQKIILLDKLELPAAKTKNFFAVLQNLKIRKSKTDKKVTIKNSPDKNKKAPAKEEAEKSEKKIAPAVLLVLPAKDEKVQRAARNIARLNIIQANSLNVVDIVKNQYLLMPLEAIKVIEKTFTSASDLIAAKAK